MRMMGHVEAAILRAVETLVGDGVGVPVLIVEEIARDDWASATFEGMNYRIAARLEGPAGDVALAAGRLTAGIGTMDIPMGGWFVAEAAAVAGSAVRRDSRHILPLIISVLAIVD